MSFRSRVYEYPFEMVMAAYEKRFPTCEMIPAFIGSDITYEYNSDDGAVTIVERRCRIHVDAPYIVRKIAGIDHFVCMQRNSLNRRDRTLKIEAWNESFDTKLNIMEYSNYSVHPDNPEWTLFEQDAKLDIVSFYGIEALVEKVAIKAYTMNMKKGKEIIIFYINQLKAEGRTEFPVFEGSEGQSQLATDPATLDNGSLDIIIETDAEFASAESGGSQPDDVNALIPPDLDDVFLTPRDQNNSRPNSSEKMKKEMAQEFKHVGNLTAKEEANLIQFRKRCKSLHLGKPPTASILLRFLRARDSNVEKAIEMLKNSLHWRRLHHVDSILETWNPEHVLEYYPGGWHHYDKDGRPVYIIRLGSMDVKGLLKTVGEDGFVKQVVSISEEGLLKCDKAADIFKKPIMNWTLIVDLDKLNMRHLWRPGIRALLKIIEIVEANYPETMGQLLIVRAPKVFGVVWTLLSPFINENTRKKFMIYTGDDYQGQGGLVDYIPKDYIPTFLNGPCECSVSEGKTVPRSLYRFDHAGEATESTWLDTDLYLTAYVMKGSPHYVPFTVSEPGAVITWDFDVIEGNCVFQVLRHKRPREASYPNVTCFAESTPEPERQTYVRPGIDAYIVEQPLTCGQGDSLQGTHICQQPGLFLLEWKYSNPVNSRPPLKFHTKTKIMYYHEVLPSRDFLGSMSSMCSSQSGFSQLLTTPSISGVSQHSSAPSHSLITPSTSSAASTSGTPTRRESRRESRSNFLVQAVIK